jgi:hypothetical protein
MNDDVVEVPDFKMERNISNAVKRPIGQISTSGNNTSKSMVSPLTLFSDLDQMEETNDDDQMF